MSGEIEKIVEQLAEQLLKGKAKRVALKTKRWSDRGVGDFREYFAVEIEGGFPLLEELLRTLYGTHTHLSGVYATDEGVLLHIRRDAINLYGDVVGSDWWIESLPELREAARGIPEWVQLKKKALREIEEEILR